MPLRPLGLGELLDGAVGVVRGFPRPVFAVGAAVALVGAGLELLALLTLAGPFIRVDNQVAGDLSFSTDQVAGGLAAAVITVLFSTFSALLLAGLVAPAVSRGTLGESLTVAQSWTQLKPRVGALVGVSMLTTLAVFGPPVLGIALTVALIVLAGNSAGAFGILLVPAGLVLGALLYVRWAFGPLCVVLEKQGVRAALRRSSILVARSWWRVLGVLLLTAIIAGIVAQILQVPFLIFGPGPSALLSNKGTSTSALVVSSIGAVLAGTIVGPFSAAVRGLLYVDRRIRAEGLDVALAAAVAAPATPSAGWSG